MKAYIFGLIIAIVATCSALADPSAGNAPDGNTSAAASPVSAGQAPDDVMNRLADLVHAGKYAEAQQLAAGLLVAYPGDSRLVKAKALLDKAVAAAAPANMATSSSPPAGNVTAPAAVPPVATAASEQLTGMDKVEYNSLIELGREAQQTTDLEQQTKLLQQFIDESGPFLLKHPSQMLLWQIRAASALSLGDPFTGYEAGQHLLTLGGADSSDAGVQELLSKLNLKGWLNPDRVIAKGHDWEIKFNDWYQYMLRSRAKAELLEGQSYTVQGHTFSEKETKDQVASAARPSIQLAHLISGKVFLPMSNDADKALAKTDAGADIAQMKALWAKNMGRIQTLSNTPKVLA